MIYEVEFFEVVENEDLFFGVKKEYEIVFTSTLYGYEKFNGNNEDYDKFLEEIYQHGCFIASENGVNVDGLDFNIISKEIIKRG